MRHSSNNATALAPSIQVIGGKSSVLDNGVRICTEYVPGVRSISIGVMVACGSRNDRPVESGMAHLCEHLLFQGTTGRSAVQIARHMDSAAGNIGAFTTRDYTCYYATVLDDYCFHALDLLGDVLLNSVFPEESLEREKRVIANEIQQTDDIPPYLLNQRMKETLWSGHALGQRVAGTSETLAAVTREDVIYYFHRNYTPDRMTICAAGNVDHEDFAAQARDAFWRLLGQGEPSGLRPAVSHSGVRIEPRAGGQTYFCLGIPAPRFAHERRYNAHVLARILGGGVSSRLFRTLRETGLAYDISAEYEAYHEGGVLSIEGSSAAEDLPEALGRTLDTVWDVLTGRAALDEEEVGRALTQIRAQHLIASQDVHTRMSRLGTQQLYFGRRVRDEEILQSIGECTVDSLNETAAEDLGSESPCLTVSCPPALAGRVEDLFFQKCRATSVPRQTSLNGLFTHAEY